MHIAPLQIARNLTKIGVKRLFTTQNILHHKICSNSYDAFTPIEQIILSQRQLIIDVLQMTIIGHDFKGDKAFKSPLVICKIS